jgi:chromosome segregation ATPase
VISHVDEYRNQLEIARQENLTLHEKIVKLTQDLDGAKLRHTRDGDSLNARISELEKIYEEKEGEVSQIRRRNDALLSQIRHLEEQLLVAEGRNANLVRELDVLKESTDKVQASSMLLKAWNEDAASEGARLHKELSRLQGAEIAWQQSEKSLRQQLEEIREQLTSQTRKAQEAETRLSEILVVLEATFEDKEYLVEAIAQLEEECSQTARSVEGVLQRELALVRDLDAKSLELSDSRKSVERLELEKTSLKHELDHLQTQLGHMTADVSEADADQRNLVAERDRLLLREKSLVQEVQQLERDVGELSQRFRDENNALRSRSQQREDDLSSQVEKLQSELDTLRGQHRTMMSQDQSLLKQLEATTEAQRAELESVKSELDLFRRDNDEQRLSLTKLSHEREMEVSSLRKQLADVTNERDILRTRVDRLEATLRSEDGEHQKLVDAHKKLEKEFLVKVEEAKNLRVQAEALMSGSASGFRSPVKGSASQMGNKPTVEEFEKRLREARDEVHQLKLRVALLEAQNTSLDAEAQRLRAKVEDFRTENDELHAERLRLSADLQKLEFERSRAVTQATVAEDRESHLQYVVDALSNLRESFANAESSTILNQISYMTESLQRAQSDAESAREAYRRTVASSAEKETLLMQMRIDIANMQEKVNESQAQIEGLRAERDRLSDQLTTSLRESVAAFEEGSRAALALRRENDKLRSQLALYLQRKAPSQSGEAVVEGIRTDVENEQVLDEMRDLLHETMKRLDDEEEARSKLTDEIHRRDEVIRKLRENYAVVARVGEDQLSGDQQSASPTTEPSPARW